MEKHELSESFIKSFSNIAVNKEENGNEDKKRGSSKKKITGKNISVQPHDASERNATVSDSEWLTTTDTSVHSSPSADEEVPNDVLEKCDGLDELNLSSPDTKREQRGRRGRGRGRGFYRVNSRKSAPARPIQESSSSTGSSDSASSSDSEDETTSEDTSDSDSESTLESGTSLSGSEDSQTTYTSHSTNSESEDCDDSCSCCSCSCCEDSSVSSTSYESTDDLTDLPRVKRGGRLGSKGSKKVAQHCAQS
ncbi:dentin sialophosphoprotein-like isoform X1 [Macrosteles quadrilineatus]|uniref:dentin sialophosphoprotein-like isoform X1 n=1 Tax=Macrosteles quadrilineatus TaxID=74068 RepID=UPI0023E20C98|nr:dentin sialophosphoprotein-like isoform X1 [Macrosteles quadrilineatus]